MPLALLRRMSNAIDLDTVFAAKADLDHVRTQLEKALEAIGGELPQEVLALLKASAQCKAALREALSPVSNDNAQAA
jgi:hypothetical protein